MSDTKKKQKKKVKLKSALLVIYFVHTEFPTKLYSKTILNIAY